MAQLLFKYGCFSNLIDQGLCQCCPSKGREQASSGKGNRGKQAAGAPDQVVAACTSALAAALEHEQTVHSQHANEAEPGLEASTDADDTMLTDNDSPDSLIMDYTSHNHSTDHGGAGKPKKMRKPSQAEVQTEAAEHLHTSLVIIGIPLHITLLGLSCCV